MPKLIFEDKGVVSLEAILSLDEMSVGRGRDNDIQLFHASVSRRHSLLLRDGSGYRITDLRSKNGTYINGARIREVRLKSGDIVEFGSITARYVSETDATVASSPEDPLPMLQKIFRGRFAVKRPLGSGSQAEVYLAFTCNRDIPVALKILKGRVTSRSDLADEFFREGEALQKLNHKAIVPLLDLGRLSGVAFIALSYVPGGSVDDLLHRGPLSVRAAIVMARRMLLALTHAHARNIIHRDIKPANILIDRNGDTLLADFGIAKILDDSNLTSSGCRKGTPLYMSPEQMGTGGIDHRTDLYSLAATLYRSLTGKPPIDGSSIYDLTKKVPDPSCRPRPIMELRPEIPRAFARLIHSCLEKRREDRPADAAAAFEDLANIRQSG